MTNGRELARWAALFIIFALAFAPLNASQAQTAAGDCTTQAGTGGLLIEAIVLARDGVLPHGQVLVGADGRVPIGAIIDTVTAQEAELGDRPAGFTLGRITRSPARTPLGPFGSRIAPGDAAVPVPRCQKSILSVRDPLNRDDNRHRDRVLPNRTND